MTTKQCPKCGIDLPANRMDGLCPKCVLQPLLTEDDSSPDGVFPIRFGDFDLLREVGRGGMGVVYEARNLKLGVIVALKRIRQAEIATPQELERLRLEAVTTANCRHPNIVAVHEFGEVNGEYYFTMDFIEGKNLAQRIAKQEFAIPETRAKGNKTQARQTQVRIAKLMATVARAVHHAHECRFLHRDLTPSNILVDANDQPFITDFGVAKALSVTQDAVSGSHVVGKPSYMAPEQATGKRISFATDIYGLGAILYELLTGRPPFRGTTPLDTLRLITDRDVENPSSYSAWVDQDLASICLKCLEKEPGRRYSTALDLAEDLERWLQGKPVKARRAGPMRRAWRWVRRNPVGTALIATLTLGLIILFILQGTARQERVAKEYANNSLIKWIGYSIDTFVDPSQDSLFLPSETLASFTGRESLPGPATKRVAVGVFVVRRSIETALGFADVLHEFERSIYSEMGRVVRFDLKLYRNYEAAQADLVRARVDLMRAEPRLYLEIENTTLHPVLLMGEAASDLNGVIFTRRDTGITNLAGLAGRSFALWDRHSSISLLAKWLLHDANLTQTNLECAYLLETAKFATQRAKGDVEAIDFGYLDRQGATVEAVKAGQFDAGIGIEWQLQVSMTNAAASSNFWVRLASFQVPGCVWFARTNFDADVLGCLERVMQGIQKNPRVFLGRNLLGDVEIKRVNEKDYQTLRRALAVEGGFDGERGSREGTKERGPL